MDFITNKYVFQLVISYVDLDNRTFTVESEELVYEKEECSHEYDNDCDEICNICGETRVVHHSWICLLYTSLQEHLMKCIETGSNPAFTFTYDDSSELLLTDYNSYYYTLYTRWLSDVENICDTLNAVSYTHLSIEVWMTLGRDQANVVRNLIDTTFTKETGIKVDLKLTGADVLLKATLAGIGPDVALNVDSSLPVNYALRNAVYDLTNFDDRCV